jgi:glycolate oxidase FAD binding subunit
MHEALAAIAEQIRAAAARHEPLRIRAGGSKDFYGNPPRGTVLDPRALCGIVSYEPTELALTVRCGTPLAQVEAALDEQGQMLAFEPPHYGHDATIGGCIASALAGPRRASAGYSYGGVRDFVLGAKLLDGQAQLLSFGGMVMKNVAGYDVARLLTGSLGVLGVIIEVSLKVVPKHQVERTLRFVMSEAAALHQLNAWGAQPLPISASAWHTEALFVRLSGSAAAIEAAAARLGGKLIEAGVAAQFWRGLREQTDTFFAGEAPLWRLSVPSSGAPVELGTQQLIEWGGALRWLRCTHGTAQIRARAQALGGHATLFRGGDRTQGVFTPLAPAVAAIHRRLRAQFDPHGIFDAGRMYPESHDANHAR